MLQLICHQNYSWNGIPVDLSPCHNHGNAEHVKAFDDGATTASGALRFFEPQARVRVKPNNIWQRLKALKIEALARIDSNTNSLRAVAKGDNSFFLGLTADGWLRGYIEDSGQSITVESTAQWAPDGNTHLVPTDRWVTLGLYHDGLAWMELRIDGEVVGRRNVTVPVRAVGPRGVAIGNAHDHAGGGPLIGEIDEIKFWRDDPEDLKRELLSRPYDEATAACWEAAVGAVRAAYEQNPTLMRQCASNMQALLDAQLRAVLMLDKSLQDELAAIMKDFMQLWVAGNIDGPGMEDVLHRWFKWWRDRAGLEFPDQSEIDRLLKPLQSLFPKGVALDCDPKLTAFLARMLAIKQGK